MERQSESEAAKKPPAQKSGEEKSPSRKPPQKRSSGRRRKRGSGSGRGHGPGPGPGHGSGSGSGRGSGQGQRRSRPQGAKGPKHPRSRRKKKHPPQKKLSKSKRGKRSRGKERFINGHPIPRPSSKPTPPPRVYTTPRIFTLRTGLGMEKPISEELANHFANNGSVTSIVLPVNLKGYVFVEATDYPALRRGVSLLPTAQQLVNGEMLIDDVLHYLSPDLKTQRPSGMVEGDIVDIIEGRYKGHCGMITHVKENDKTVIVEMIDEFLRMKVKLKRSEIKHQFTA